MAVARGHGVVVAARHPSPVVVLRFVAILGLLAVALSIGLYFYTRDRRYLTWAWRVAQFAFVVVIVAMVLYALERLVLI